MNINYSNYLLANIDNLLCTNNHLLLFHYGNLNHNSLYVCLTEDLLEHSDIHGLSYEETIHLYYPFLYEKNIFTKVLLDEWRKDNYNDIIPEAATSITLYWIGLFWFIQSDIIPPAGA